MGRLAPARLALSLSEPAGGDPALATRVTAVQAPTAVMRRLSQAPLTRADSANAIALAPRDAALLAWPFGPRAGQNALTLQGATPRGVAFDQNLCADMDGFSL